MKNKIEDYIVLESTRDYSRLREQVLQYSKIGYLPLGGVSVFVIVEITFYQAMVKYSKE